MASPLKVLSRAGLNRRVAVLVGTRPSLVKMSPLIRELARRQLDFFVIHTGQHYSYELDRAFFDDLELPEPLVRLQTVRNYRMHGEQTAEMLRGVEQALLEHRPAALVVGGDANSNLAGALAARKLNVQLCHDEAGLRSYDWLMPEEHNRIMIDHISEYLFAPNEAAARVLREECVRGRIFVVGTSTVDAVTQNLELARRKSAIVERLGLEPRRYAVMTVHHEENTDYPEHLAGVMEGARRAAHALGVPIILPAHPRTVQRLNSFQLTPADAQAIRLIEPLGYLDMLALLADALISLTDSGGVTQESAILRVPCVTLNLVTEWREVVAAGANLICGTDPARIEAGAVEMSRRARDWQNPFGEPGTGARIADILEQQVLEGQFLPPRPALPAEVAAR